MVELLVKQPSFVRCAGILGPMMYAVDCSILRTKTFDAVSAACWLGALLHADVQCLCLSMA